MHRFGPTFPAHAFTLPAPAGLVGCMPLRAWMHLAYAAVAVLLLAFRRPRLLY